MFGLKKFFSKEAPIGVDITNESIVLVELKPGDNGGIELVKLGVTPTPENAVRDVEIVDPVRVAAAIEELMLAHGVKSRKVVTAVSGQAAIIRAPIKFPKVSLKELKEVVIHQADRYIPFQISDVYIDFQVLDTVEEGGSSKYDVLLVAAQKQLIDSYLETFVKVGLQLVAVDVASFATMRALSGADEEVGDDKITLLVLIRGETTDLTVVRSGMPLFSRSIPIGSSTFVEEIAQSMNLELSDAIELFDKLIIPLAGDSEISDPQLERASSEIKPVLKELTTELQRSIEYFHQSQPDAERIQQIVLADKGARIKNLDHYLSQVLGIDIEIGNPVKFLYFNEAQFPLQYLKENSAVFSTAIGLARRGLEEF